MVQRSRTNASTIRSRIASADNSSVYMNDDVAEKEHRRQSNNTHHGTSRRQSLVQAARDMQSSGNGEKTVPVLANFEAWMKLVKDNKINATNSWNFALIDYFHDMSLLKEGDGINFQKASYTLDGCVKIYTSRIDSVASETGKLLSGLAESSKQQKTRHDSEEASSSDDENASFAEDESEDGEKKKSTKRRTNKAESTLAKSAESLQVKKLDLELSIDPLFRKMCADFDEGGAKGLLLNSLVSDMHGRVVFDGELNESPKGVDFGDGARPLFVDNTNDTILPEDEENSEEEEMEEDIAPIDLEAIKNRFFPDLYQIDNFEICPSVYNIDGALKDPSLMSSAFAKEMEKMENEKSTGGLGEEVDDEEVDIDANFDDFGGMNFENDLEDSDEHSVNVSNNGGIIYSNTSGRFALASVGADQDILSYFDETLKKNWAGPEHWKIQRLKNLSTGKAKDAEESDDKKENKRVPKEPFLIDFLQEGNEIDERELFAPSSATINLTKAQQKTNDANLLPDDQHFTSQNLIRLFLKPKGRVVHRLFGRPSSESEEEMIQEEEAPAGNYDANFFHDDEEVGGGEMGDDFFGEDYGSEQPLIASSQTNLTGTSKARPEYVSYARTAKRVNVKLLKNNIWKLMDMNDLKPEEERKFTQVVQQLNQLYSPQQLSELSTSFCFICTLHLANEMGLMIETNDTHDELTIKPDPTAGPIVE